MTSITYLGRPIRTEAEYAWAIRDLCLREGQRAELPQARMKSTAPKGTKSRVRVCIELIMQDGQARTVKEINDLINANRSTVSFYVKELRREGFLEMVSGGARLKTKYRMGEGR